MLFRVAHTGRIENKYIDAINYSKCVIHAFALEISDPLVHHHITSLFKHSLDHLFVNLSKIIPSCFEWLIL